jgi:thiamine biosynthesis protein ThiS
MEITLNGEKRTLETPLTVTGLLQSLGINPQSVVVERNLKIVPPSEMKEEAIQEADSIEIIKLVSGG